MPIGFYPDSRGGQVPWSGDPGDWRGGGPPPFDLWPGSEYGPLTGQGGYGSNWPPYTPGWGGGWPPGLGGGGGGGAEVGRRGGGNDWWDRYGPYITTGASALGYGLTANRSRNDARNEYNQLQRYFQGQVPQYQGQADRYFDRASAPMTQFLQNQGAFANPLLGLSGTENLLGQLQNFRRGLPGQYAQVRDPQIPHQLRDIMQRSLYGADRATDILNTQGATGESAYFRDRMNDIMLSRTGETSRMRDEAYNILDAGGRTPQMNEISNTLLPIMQAQGYTPTLQQMSGAGMGIISAGGQTADTKKALDMFMGVLAAGGRDAGTAQLSGMGSDLITSGGMTPEMTKLMQEVYEGIEERGFTPQTAELMNEIMQMVKARGQGGALLPMETATSFARDAAGTAYAQRAEAARRTAQQRTGGAEFAGTTQQAMAEFGDEAARGEAQAVREMALGQQELQLQQLLGALGAGTDLSRTAGGVLSSYLGLGGDLSRSAAMNIATGGGMMSAAEAAAANRFGSATSGTVGTLNNEVQRLMAGIQLGLGAEGIASDRFRTATGGAIDVEGIAQRYWEGGMGSLNSLIGNQLNAGSMYLGSLGLDAQREGMGFNALNNLLGLNAGIVQGQQNLELGLNQSQNADLLNALGLSGNIQNQFFNQNLGAAGLLSNIGGMYMSPINSLYGSMGGLGGSYLGNPYTMQPGAYENLFGGMLGGSLRGLGNYFMNPSNPYEWSYGGPYQGLGAYLSGAPMAGFPGMGGSGQPGNVIRIPGTTGGSR